jgi:hypothetical protein
MHSFRRCSMNQEHQENESMNRVEEIYGPGIQIEDEYDRISSTAYDEFDIKISNDEMNMTQECLSSLGKQKEKIHIESFDKTNSIIKEPIELDYCNEFLVKSTDRLTNDQKIYRCFEMSKNFNIHNSRLTEQEKEEILRQLSNLAHAQAEYYLKNAISSKIVRKF